MPLRRRLGPTLALAGLAFVLVATLTPLERSPRAAQRPRCFCLVCGDQGGADVVDNLLLFLPLAVGLRLSGRSPGGSRSLAAFLLSFNVELLQYWLVPGRDASLSDLVTNTASGAIGATLVHLPRAGSRLPPASGTMPWPSGVGAAGGTSAARCLGLADGAGRARRAHFSAAGPTRPPAGTCSTAAVQSVRLDGLPMPANGPPPDSAGRRRRLDAGQFDLDVDVVPAGR